ncbi:hypothetical protein ACFLV5_06365 [Chloroflexota bacterium]
MRGKLKLVMVLMLVTVLTVPFFSTMPVLATQSTIVFSDDFDDGDTDQELDVVNDHNVDIGGNWDVDTPTPTTNACWVWNCGGNYLLSLRTGAYLEKQNISTAGLQNIHLEYDWGKYDGTTTGNLEVYWKLSSDASWTLLNSHALGPASFSCTPPYYVDANLSGAENTSIDIRFLGNTPAGTANRAFVDDVIVSGDPMPVLLEVGSEDVYPVNKPAVLAPWLALTLVIAAGGFYMIRRRVHS